MFPSLLRGAGTRSCLNTATPWSLQTRSIRYSSRVRKPSHRRYKFLALLGSPFRRVIVERMVTRTPCKPDSAKRQCAKVRIPKTGQVLYAYMPYKKFPLAKWNRILIRGGWGIDVPQVKTKIVRGKLDCPSPQNVGTRRRSKLGLGPKRKPQQKVTKVKQLKIWLNKQTLYNYDI